MSHKKSRALAYPAIATVAACSATLQRHKVRLFCIDVPNEETHRACAAADKGR